MTDDELKELVASLAIAQKETDRQIKETDRQLKETDRRLERETRELRKRMEESGMRLERDTQELKKQMGAVWNKFGSYTEGLIYPSIMNILDETFDMDEVGYRMKCRGPDGSFQAFDFVGWKNGEDNTAIVVEVKSLLRDESLDQMGSLLAKFRSHMPEHNDKKLFGMLAVVDVRDENTLIKKILDKGYYLVRPHKDSFELLMPEGFTPKPYIGMAPIPA
jgi:hypothetical protein